MVAERAIRNRLAFPDAIEKKVIGLGTVIARLNIGQNQIPVWPEQLGGGRWAIITPCMQLAVRHGIKFIEGPRHPRAGGV